MAAGSPVSLPHACALDAKSCMLACSVCLSSKLRWTGIAASVEREQRLLLQIHKNNAADKAAQAAGGGAKTAPSAAASSMATQKRGSQQQAAAASSAAASSKASPNRRMAHCGAKVNRRTSSKCGIHMPNGVAQARARTWVGRCGYEVLITSRLPASTETSTCSTTVCDPSRVPPHSDCLTMQAPITTVDTEQRWR